MVDETVTSCLAQKFDELNAVVNGPALVRCRLLQPDWRIEHVNKNINLIGGTNVSNRIVSHTSCTGIAAAAYVSLNQCIVDIARSLQNCAVSLLCTVVCCCLYQHGCATVTVVM